MNINSIIFMEYIFQKANFFNLLSFLIQFIRRFIRIMKINQLLRFSLSTCYDLITIGPYANRIAKTVARYSRQSISILTVQEQNKIIEPSLIPSGSSTVNITQHNHKFSNIEMGVGVQQFNPGRSEIILMNGAKYQYKNLVYSGDPSDWKGQDSISIDSLSIKNSHSFIYDDLDYNNIDELFAMRSGSIIFTVPKEVHFGYQNYFMMLLNSKMKYQRQKVLYELDPINITVICQGNSLVPFNTQYNNILQSYFKKFQIKLIKNADYSINYRKKLIKINSQKNSIKFDSLFHYLPIKTPKVLIKNKINPFENNRHTLNNSKYQNMYILGNVVNNVYSLSSIEEMSKVITENVLNSIHKVNKKVLYNGESSINIWINEKECHYIETDYNGSRLKMNIGQSAFQRRIIAFNKLEKLKYSVQKQINSGCGRFSAFNRPDEIITDRFQVPALATAS